MKLFIRLLITVALFVVIHRTAAQVPFTLSASPYIGNFVRSVAVADVNGDGWPDLIGASAGRSTLVIYTNNGSGIFVSNIAYPVGSFPYQVIAADVNNDGWPDLITANQSGNSVTVLTNDGKGGFVLAATLSAGTSHPHSVAAADLNGDGKLDLICPGYTTSTVIVWTNSGGGVFVSNASYATGTSPASVAIADVNGDGYPDIICANSGDSIHHVTVLTNNGTGGFSSTPTPYLGANGASWVTAADVNGDGKIDLILITPFLGYTAVSVLTNNGTGGFALSSNYTGVFSAPYAVVAADVNGDGFLDLIAANQGNNNFTVLTNDGSGNFSLSSTPGVGSGPESMAVGDVNGDGRVDLISGNWNDGTLTVLTNGGAFMPQLAITTSAGNVIISWPAIWANWSLKQSPNLNPAVWTGFGGPIGNDGTTKRATNSSPVNTRFFRLSNP